MLSVRPFTQKSVICINISAAHVLKRFIYLILSYADRMRESQKNVAQLTEGIPEEKRGTTKHPRTMQIQKCVCVETLLSYPFLSSRSVPSSICCLLSTLFILRQALMKLWKKLYFLTFLFLFKSMLFSKCHFTFFPSSQRFSLRSRCICSAAFSYLPHFEV